MKIWRGFNDSQKAVWCVLVGNVVVSVFGLYHQHQQHLVPGMWILAFFGLTCLILLLLSFSKSPRFWYRSLYRCDGCGAEKTDDFDCTECGCFATMKRVPI